MLSFGRSRGYDTELGRHLYHDVCTAGLVDVQAEGHVFMHLGGSPAARFWRVTLEQQQDHLLVAGLLTQTEVEEYRTLLESSEFVGYHRLRCVWGHRPPA